MRKAVVTGHSRGLGEAIAALLEAEGWVVLGVSRSAGVRVDLSSPGELASWLDSGDLTAFLGDASEILLINNAGAVAPMEVAGRQSIGEIASSVNLNVTAAMALTDAVLRERPDGTPVRVVHISSGAARRAYPGWSVYCATKAALDMHAQVIASEGHRGVRIAALAPGVVETAMQAQIRDAEGFPLRDRFVALNDDGQLTSVGEAAARVLALIDAPDFGQRVIADVHD